MRDSMTVKWGEIEDRVTSVETDINQFSPSAPALVGVDLSPVADEILAQGAAEAAMQGSPDQTAGQVEAAYQGVSDEAQAEVARVQAEGSRIMTELYTDLPGILESLVAEAAETTASALLLQAKAQQMAPAMESNPLKTAAQKEAFVTDLGVLNGEVEQLNELASQISRDSGGMTGRLGRALTEFEGKVGALRGGR